MTIDTIETISLDEFKARFRKKGYFPLSKEGQAIRNMEPGTAVRFPCRWKHIKGRWKHIKGQQTICVSRSMISYIARRLGYVCHTTCRDGMVYVMREA